MKNNKVLKVILKYFPIYIISIGLLIIGEYIASLSGLFVGEVLGTFNGDESVLPGFLARFVSNESLESKIISLAIIYIIVYLCLAIVNFIGISCRGMYGKIVYGNLRKEYYKHVIDIPKNEYAKRSTGDIIQRNIEDCKRVGDIFSHSLYAILRTVFTAVSVLLQMYILNKIVFIYTLISVLIAGFMAFYYGYFKVKDKELASSRYYSELNSTLQQSITNYSLIKSFASEDYEFERFKTINDKKENNNYDVLNLFRRYWLMADGHTTIYQIVCILICGVLFFNNQASLAVVSSIVVLSTKILQPVCYLVNNVTSFLKASISNKRLKEYFNIENEYVNDGTIDKDIEGNIEFKNVYMKYDKEYILKDISFSLKEGETLGIVGKSGSGKTSIINLLTRLDEYESGSIRIDGVELKDYKKKCLRNNLGVVLQDAYIFSKSVKDNLLILIDNDRIDLDMYLKRVGLDEDIDKFESGLETIVGERGVTLSGGQRQRMSLLRTIIKNKKVLILDDTLSAVDNIVSRQIKDSIKKEKATTIIISHNLLNVKDADKIIVLDKGEIVDIGTHDELVAKEGFYSNVWSLQQKLEEVKVDE